jgi:hypothetical protein
VLREAAHKTRPSGARVFFIQTMTVDLHEDLFSQVQDLWGNFIALRVALVVFGVARGALDTQQVGVDDTDATPAFAANRT